jgi:hypothetical protein
MARPHRAASESTPRADASPRAGDAEPALVAMPVDRERDREHPLDTFGTLVCVLIVFTTVGFVCFRVFSKAFLPDTADATIARSFFTSINALTSTGFAQSWAAVADYKPAGRVLLAILSLLGTGVTWLGGGILLARAAKMRVSWPVLIAMSAGLMAIADIAMFGLGWFDALSAVSGLGLTAFASPYTASQATLHWIALPLFMVGALGPVLLIASWRLMLRHDVPELLSGTLAFMAASFVVSVLLIAPMLGSKFSGPQTLAASSALALNARGLGVPIGQLSDLPVAVAWVQMALMLLGNAWNAIPIALLLIAGHRLVRGAVVPAQAGVAIAWIAIQLLLVFVAVVGLSISDKQIAPDRALFIAVSAVSNVGLSHDPLGLENAGSAVLSGVMLFGKMLPLAMLAWMARLAEPAKK